MSQLSADEAAFVARARDLASSGKSQRQIAAELGKPRHWVRYNVQAKPVPAPLAIAPGIELKFHPLADLFPLIEGEEFAALVASIGANGLREPIVLFEDKILDGRNRYRACLKAGTDLRFEALPENADALTYVVDRNLRRRQLNDDQRRMVAARIANLQRGRPAENSAECSIKIDEAAQLVNVDKAGVKRARIVVAHASAEIQGAVARGKLTVASAVQAARLDPEKQRRIAEQAEAGRTNVVRTVIKQEARAVRERELGAKQRALPDGRFGFILADPEWDRDVYSRETGMDRHAANQYPVSSDEIIAARDVPSIAAPDCTCGLWCTDPHRGVDVMRAWGFEPKSYFVWVKDIVEVELTPEQIKAGLEGRHFKTIGAPGNGFWNRDRDELLLIGTCGHPVCPAPGLQGKSVWFAARPRHADGKIIHSAKPECSFEWIERHFPNTPKIELNRRGPARPGWMAWGSEAQP